MPQKGKKSVGSGIFPHKKHTEETKKKISASCKGLKHSPEAIARRTGRKLSVYHRQRLSEAHKGAKSVWWKGGVKPLHKKIRKSLELRLWHKAVLERDRFTCQKTGQNGGKLIVHHIHNFADYPELRTSIENGITLTAETHRVFHKKYGYKNNTKEQLDEFLKT